MNRWAAALRVRVERRHPKLTTVHPGLLEIFKKVDRVIAVGQRQRP